MTPCRLPPLSLREAHRRLAEECEPLIVGFHAMHQAAYTIWPFWVFDSREDAVYHVHAFFYALVKDNRAKRISLGGNRRGFEVFAYHDESGNMAGGMPF